MCCNSINATFPADDPTGEVIAQEIYDTSIWTMWNVIKWQSRANKQLFETGGKVRHEIMNVPLFNNGTGYIQPTTL